MIEGVVFDVDGVLVRGGAFGERLRERGVDRAALDEFWRGPYARCALGDADLHEELEPFLEVWGYGGTADGFLREWLEADSTLDADVLAEVERLRRRGIPCHVASNQERHRARYLEETMGLRARFGRLFFSCRLGVKKPQPSFFRRIAAELGARPGALLLIDDQSANTAAARAAGWQAETYRRGDELSALLARHALA